MKNTKKILAFISVLAIAASFAACSKDGGNQTGSTDTTTAADSAAPDSTGAENPSGQENGQTQGGPPTVELQEIAMSPEFAEKCLNKVDYPKFSVKADASAADFAGSWACTVMTKGEYLAYDAIFEVPLTATDHLIISEDGTGVVSLVKDSSTTNETPFTYTIEDGKLIATVQVRTGPPAGVGGSQGNSAQAAASAPQSTAGASSDDETKTSDLPPVVGQSGENSEPPVGAEATQGGPPANAGQSGEGSGAPAGAGNTQGGPPALTVVMQITEDGQLVINGEDADGDATSAIYTKVDKFDSFDFDSVNFDYSGLLR